MISGFISIRLCAMATHPAPTKSTVYRVARAPRPATGRSRANACIPHFEAQARLVRNCTTKLREAVPGLAPAPSIVYTTTVTLRPELLVVSGEWLALANYCLSSVLDKVKLP